MCTPLGQTGGSCFHEVVGARAVLESLNRGEARIRSKRPTLALSRVWGATPSCWTWACPEPHAVSQTRLRTVGLYVRNSTVPALDCQLQGKRRVGGFHLAQSVVRAEAASLREPRPTPAESPNTLGRVCSLRGTPAANARSRPSWASRLYLVPSLVQSNSEGSVVSARSAKVRVVPTAPAMAASNPSMIAKTLSESTSSWV